jgi:hypothetical protein
MFRNKIPNCNVLFKKFLSPWYPDGYRVELPRPDMFVIPTLEDDSMSIENLDEIKKSFQLIRNAYNLDFQEFLKFKKIDLNVIDAVDKYFQKREVLSLIENSNPSDFNNQYLRTISEFGMAIGDLFVETGKFEWSYSFPYFDSIVVNRETQNSIPVFDWAVKKFSSYGINDGFKAKFLKVMEIIEEEMI